LLYRINVLYNKTIMKTKFSVIFAALLTAVFITACLGRAGKLSLPEREFLEQTSLISSSQEKKAFLALPASERQAFMEDFWARRDPDPQSPENEYREEYFRRIAEANRLFSEGGRSGGWRTDRGRIFVLLGPPDRRDAYPTGYTFYAPPVEVWYYGFFPVIFIDRFKLGTYTLEPGSAYALSQLNLTQMQLKADFAVLDQDKFSIDLKLEKKKGGLTELKIIIPAKTIVFTPDPAGESSNTVISVSVEIRNQDGSVELATLQRDFPLRVKNTEIEQLPRFLVLNLEHKLARGNYLAVVEVVNQADGARAKLEKDFRL